jgi:hypothetical protein
MKMVIVVRVVVVAVVTRAATGFVEGRQLMFLERRYKNNYVVKVKKKKKKT